MRLFFDFIKPKIMIKNAMTVKRIAGPLCLILFIFSFLWIIFRAPHDAIQGHFVHIMYVHVPASWGALAIYTVLAVFSAIGLVSRIPQAFIISKALAPIGCVFCVISLVTGSLWGKPTWGAFWVWDARLTSMFILMIIYLIYIQLSSTTSLKRLVPSAFLAVIGFINIPIIKGSVEWWYTLHQPASIKILERSFSIQWPILFPLLCMVAAFVSYALYIASIRTLYFLKYYEGTDE